MLTTFTCFLCGSTETVPHFETERLLRCVSCGLVVLAPELRIPDPDTYYASAVHYSENALSSERVKEMDRIASTHLDRIKRLRLKDGATLLDIGANYGRLVKEAGRRGLRAFGIEKNRWLVEAAKRDGVPILEGDAQHIPLKETFDIVTMIDVFEHLDAPRDVLTHLSSFMADEGYLYIEVQNIDSYLAKKDRESWRYIALEHVTHFSHLTLGRLLNECGFDIVWSGTNSAYLEDDSLPYLFHYLFGKPLQRDRFHWKKIGGRESAPPKKPMWKILLKKGLIRLIRFLHREDLILFIAKRRASE